MNNFIIFICLGSISIIDMRITQPLFHVWSSTPTVTQTILQRQLLLLLRGLGRSEYDKITLLRFLVDRTSRAGLGAKMDLLIDRPMRFLAISYSSVRATKHKHSRPVLNSCVMCKAKQHPHNRTASSPLLPIFNLISRLWLSLFICEPVPSLDHIRDTTNFCLALVRELVRCP
jgi:hypothetical protein